MPKYQKKIKTEAFKPLQLHDQETFEFLGRYCNLPSFQDDRWFISITQCNLIDSRNRSDYYPVNLKSPCFKVTINGNNDSIEENEWIQLDIFQTHFNPESETLTCYIGSESYTMEWISKPFSVDYSSILNSQENNQSNLTCPIGDYLVVASLGDGRGFDDYEVANFIEKTEPPVNRKGLIQVWKFDSNKLECVCCFANNYGTIWAFETPKGGTSYCPVKRRLSLIAAAFDDGFVRIFSLPFPEDLISQPSSSQSNQSSSILNQLPAIYNLPPVVVLEPPFSSHIVARCLSWSWCDQQNYLAVGYGNGMVNYYNLATTSSILVQSKSETNNDNNISLITTLKPVKTWIAHGAMVSAIQILPLPESKIIVTGGWDRNIKLWNIHQPRLLPILILHRSVVNCLVSSLHLPGGFFITLDEAFLASNQSIVTFKQIYEEGQKSSENRSLYTIPFETSNVPSLSLSLFFNSILVSDNSGNSILQNNFRAKHEKTTRRKLSDLLPVFTSQLKHLVAQNADVDKSANIIVPSDTTPMEVDNEKDQESVTKSKKSTASKKKGATKKGTTKKSAATSKTGPTSEAKTVLPSNGYLIDKSVQRVRSYKEMSSTYGIIFNDFTINQMGPALVPIVNKFREASNLKRSRLTDYPLTSINKCIWSPNRETRNTLANLIHSGFIRISTLAKEFVEDANSSSTTTTGSKGSKVSKGSKGSKGSKSTKKKDEESVKPRVSTRRKRSLPS